MGQSCGRTDVAVLDGIDALLCPTVMIPPVPVADAMASPEAYAERQLANSAQHLDPATSSASAG